MLPKTLALIDDDIEFTEFLSKDLRTRGIEVDAFHDSNELLARDDAFRYGFYVVDLMLPGIDGVDLIKVLRLRSGAGIVVVSGRLSPDVFKQVVSAGADMYLAKPVKFEQVAIAIEAVYRRVMASSNTGATWKLDRRARRLLTPDGSQVDLSEIDLAILECFVRAQGTVVSRDVLRKCLGRNPPENEQDGITAVIYRLRRRIERATPTTVPLHAKSRQGYVFEAPITDA